MSYTNKSTLQNFYELIKEGWEPTFNEIKEKYCSRDYDEMRRTILARLLITRVRRMLKKEDLYFYSTNGHFKLLESSKERFDVTSSLWGLTQGFHKSTNKLIMDTAKLYPNLSRDLLAEIKAGFNITNQINQGITMMLKSVISKLELKEKNEPSDK